MRRLHRVTGALASVALLAACGGAPEASPPPSASATPRVSPSASPPPAPPDIPVEVRRQDEAGSKATVRAYVDALNFAGATGDTGPLRATFVDTCTRCDAAADSIDETTQRGGSFSGGDWTIQGLTFYGIEQRIAVLDATIDYAPQTWIEESGADEVRYDGATNQLHAFQLAWTPDGWRVGALDPQA